MEPTKLEEFDTFPLTSQIGIIHAIPEEDFDIARATISDLCFFSLFPKNLFQALRKYELMIKRFDEHKSGPFRSLIDALNTAIIYRPITMQKVIQIMLTQHRSTSESIEKDAYNVHTETHSGAESTINSGLSSIETTTDHTPNHSRKQKCYASKCRILKARGIIKYTMTCSKNRNMCTGCLLEMAKQRKVNQLEQELLMLMVNNEVLAPILQFRWKTISIKAFRKALSCLPTFSTNTRNDCILGAARYLANTLGILISSTPSSNLMDPPMTNTESKQAWRKATFFCKCIGNMATTDCTVRSFCQSCSFLIPYGNNMVATKCPGCNINDSWEHIGYPCLACQFASLVYQNPFDRRYKIIDMWLPVPSDLEWSSAKSECNDAIVSQQQTTPASITTQFKHMELKNMRWKAIDDSLDTIRSKSSIEQNRCIFEDLSALKKNFMNQEFSNDSDRGSIYSKASLSSNTESVFVDKTDVTVPSPGKKAIHRRTNKIQPW
jgi:hypothetical protein